jgi:hypothetical protein
MKKLLLFSTVLMLASCTPMDFTEFQRELEDLKNRVTQLEKICEKFNSDILSLQTIVTASQQNDYITGYSALADGSGYRITFAKSGTITIKHGKDGTNGTNGIDGANGTNAPVIGIGIHNGVYYWTITTNNNTTWLLDNGGNKLRVTGEKGENGQNGEDGTNGTNGTNGVTPVLGIDALGYWTINLGEGATRLKDANGKDVKAVGVDGKDGKDGEDGEGACILKSVSEDNDNIYFTLPDGSVITIRKILDFSFAVGDATGTQVFEYGETKTYAITQSNISDAVISTPNGWKAKIQGDNLIITALGYDNYSVKEEDGIVSIIAVSESGQSVVYKINVAIESDYVKIPDIAFRTFCMINYDKNKDSKLSKTEVETIDNISCSGKLIHSLQGIEYFTALEQLDCSKNNLYAIDLSKNVALETLDCSDNQLAHIDISNLELLTTLICGKNLLTTLDVGNNTDLTKLDCQSNALTTLDVRNNTNLTTIECRDNDNLSTITVWTTFFAKSVNGQKPKLSQFIDPDGMRHYAIGELYEMDGKNHIVFDITNYGFNGAVMSTSSQKSYWTIAQSYWAGESMRLPTLAELHHIFLYQNPLNRAFNEHGITKYLTDSWCWSSEKDTQYSNNYYYYNMTIGNSGSRSTSYGNNLVSFGVATF